tara:strand:- start:288 stop:992 length:705 start_codon:yes stop_codon:yes gene_type:complete
MKPLSPEHLLWLVITALTVAGCITMRRVPDGSRAHSVFRLVLIAVVLANELAWFLYRHFSAGLPLVDNLPLHLCDISVFVMLLALLTNTRPLVEFSYYAGVSGALMAVCVPAVSETGAIRLIAEIRYFITHVALVGVGFYLTFGRRVYPERRAILRSFAGVHLYALIITPLNLLLDTNYFFTTAAPNVDFLQAFPHWLFLTGASLSFLVLFSLMHLPFAWKRRATRRERAESSA